MAEETLCLSWIDVQDIAQTSFRDLKNDKDFMDVTLACEDQSVQAQSAAPSSRGFKNSHASSTVSVPRGKTFVNLTAIWLTLSTLKKLKLKIQRLSKTS